MPTVTLSSKSQITIPADIVRALKLKAGDKLVAELIEDRIILLPKPENWAEYFAGSMKGFWGTVEEIDRYVAEVRYGWEIGALYKSFEQDPDLKAVYDATSKDEWRTLAEIAGRASLAEDIVALKLVQLEELQALLHGTDPLDKSGSRYRRTP